MQNIEIVYIPGYNGPVTPQDQMTNTSGPRQASSGCEEENRTNKIFRKLVNEANSGREFLWFEASISRIRLMMKKALVLARREKRRGCTSLFTWTWG